MKQYSSAALLLVAMLMWAPSVAADALVTFDFPTSRGFVDRMATQAAFGLNNGQMQKRADQVIFSTFERYTFAVNCVGGPVLEAATEVSATVYFTLVPAKGSFAGFALAGLHDVLVYDPPSPEEICGGPGSFGGQTGVARRLSARLGGQSAVLLEAH